MKAKLKEYKPLWTAFKKCCTSSPFQCICYIVLSVVLGLLPTVLVMCETNFIDAAISVVESEISPAVIVLPIALIILILSFQWFSKSIKGILSAYMQCNISNKIGLDIFDKQASLEYSKYEDANIHDLIKRVSKTPEKRFVQTFENILLLLSSIITVISTIGLMIAYIPFTALIIMAASLVLFIVAMKSGKANYEATKEALALERKNDYLGTVLTGREAENERAIFQYSDYLNEKWKDNARKYNKVVFKTKFKWFVNMKMGAIITAVISMIAAMLLLRPYSAGVLTLGFFISIVNAINKLVTKLSWQLTDTVDVLAQNTEYMKDYETLMDMPSIAHESKEADFTNIHHINIEFSHVTFTYPNSTEPTLHDVSFRIKDGVHYAIVGPNGAGKSTVIKLLVGLYSCYSGNIYVNGHELREFSAKELTLMFSVIFQDYAKYQLSVRENITFDSESENKNLERLIKDENDPAHLKSFIFDLENGVDTKIGKIYGDGKDLSLGQWQKIAILRSLVRNAALYVLDEPTSAMDPLSEQEFFYEYAKMITGKTSVAISHRLGSVKNVDRIIVMDHGMIISEGTHEQLMNICPIYSNMYNKQKEWYLL